PASWRGRRRADVDALQWCSVRHEPPRRAEEELGQVHCAAVQVTADEVAVVRLELGGAHRVAGEYAAAESGREPLDLRFDALGHVDRRAIRDVAVGPCGVLPGGRA